MINSMARFTIRNLDEDTIRGLKARAVINGRSVAEEAHEILKAELSESLECELSPSQPDRDPNTK